MTLTIHINRRFVLCALVAIVVSILFAVRMQASAAASDNANAATPCPPTAEPHITPASVLRLEHGYMVWFGDIKTVYVMYDGQGSTTSGTFEKFTDTWQEGMPELDLSIAAPKGLWQPIRGFGKVWRDNPRVRNGLGWGLGGSSGYMAVVATQGNKTWFNGRDNAFQLIDNHWEDIYAWRK